MEKGPLEIAAEAIGVPNDQFRLVFCFLASIFLGFVQWGLVRGKKARELYSLVCGLGLGVLMYGVSELKHFAITSSVTYGCMLMAPREKVAVPVLVLNMAYLSFMHIHRMIVDWMGWSMDATGLQMMMIIKLTSLAYSYQDGAVEKTAPERIPQEQKRLIVREIPSILEYYSYLCFYPSFLVGPSFEYMDYKRFSEQVEEYKEVPNPVPQALKVLGLALLFSGLTVYGGAQFDYEYMVYPEFDRQSFLYKAVYFNLAMVVCKIRYTCAWKFTEAGMVASGMAFAGYTKGGKPSWFRGVSINYWEAELGATAKHMIDNWNISVAVWLRRCVFNRVAISGEEVKPSPLRRSMAQHTTFIVSALWHGFYPSYYPFFFLFSIHSEVSKMAYVSDFSWLPLKPVVKWVAWSFMWQIGNVLGIMFTMLTIERSLTVLKAIYAYPLIVLIAAYCFFKLTGLHRKNRTKKTN